MANSPTTQRSMTVVTGAPASDNSQHSFTKFPLELHLKIISHFPVIPDAVILADPWTFQRSTDGPDYLARFRVLLALSQTCRALRVSYLPVCWERVQVMHSGANRKWQNDLGRGLEIQSEGLMTKSPHLLPLVKIVTVCLVPSKICKPMPSFVELLANLPNLHTIQIMNRGSDVLTGLLRKLFYGRFLPSVRSVILPSEAYDILRCCPGIREVTCNEWNGAHLVQGLTEGNCNEVEVLRGIFPSDFYVKRLAKLSPPLRSIRLEARDETAEALRMFSAFPSLRTIEIECREGDVQKGLDLIDVAKKTLRECSTYRPPKCRSARVNKQAEENRERLAALYPEPMMVKVIYHPDIATWVDYGHHDSSYFYPTRVEEYPV